MQTQTEQHQQDTTELYYQLIQLLDHNDTQQKDIYDKIRYGILHKFDIYYEVTKTTILDMKKGIAIIGTEEYPISEYWTEIEQRRILIQQTLQDLQPDMLATPRGL